MKIFSVVFAALIFFCLSYKSAGFLVDDHGKINHGRSKNVKKQETKNYLGKPLKYAAGNMSNDSKSSCKLHLTLLTTHTKREKCLKRARKVYYYARTFVYRKFSSQTSFD